MTVGAVVRARCYCAELTLTGAGGELGLGCVE